MTTDIPFFHAEAVQTFTMDRILFQIVNYISLVQTASNYGYTKTVQITSDYVDALIYSYEWDLDSASISNVDANTITLNNRSLIDSISFNTVTIQHSKFSEIHCVKCNGSAIAIDSSNFTLTSITVTSSKAFNGGALYAKNCKHTALIEDSIFSNNQATLQGGALFMDSVKFDLQNCSITGNAAFIAGGIKYMSVLPKALQQSLRVLEE